MATNITKEEDNFLRIVYLNYRVGTKALRRYFDNVHPNLPSDLSSPTNKSILAILHKPPRGQRRVLYQEQWDILYPPSGNQHDVKDAAEAKSKSLDYNSLQELVHIDTRLNYHTNEIAKQTSKIEKLETTVEAMEKDVQLVKKDLQVGTPNDFMIERITSWEKDDIQYIETRATKHVLSCVSKYKCVSVIGPSGCGKTALVRHVALQLKRNGYTILTVIDAKQIKEYYKSERKTMYIVDDMCGNFTANQARLDEWKKSKTDIEDILQSGNFIFNNKLEEKQLTGKDPKVTAIIEDIIEKCEIDEHIKGRTLKSQLEILTGTFVTYEVGIYQTIHDKLFDFLAYYFGTQKQPLLIDILIKHAEDKFVRERFVVTNDNESTHYLIPISSDKLQMYMKRVFDDMVSSCNVILDIFVKNKNLENVEFRALLCEFMEHLSNQAIIALIEKANMDFLNNMFVRKKKDIKDKVTGLYQEYECFGIILTDDVLHQYIEKWFTALIGTKSPHELMKKNRLFKCFTFCTALKSYLRRLNTENIASIIQTGSKDFLNTMIVMAEHDINDFAKNQNERFGIVIHEGMLHNYIDRWFNDLTKYVGEDDSWSGTCNVLPSSIRSWKAKTWMVTKFINENRPLDNLHFVMHYVPI
ncbi:Hypothetical predicted protein [Mytilus galloprovincialis]|uniref:Novel STAND NTPase 3 domain-containing protein n=1 Tax=Mytilus galloprovincialis TaxID=29158 RepID=A0A8B6DF66_MYTGA|nr:Hypothetical predicted protein [Mytilus galloprovincialis]